MIAQCKEHKRMHFSLEDSRDLMQRMQMIQHFRGFTRMQGFTRFNIQIKLIHIIFNLNNFFEFIIINLSLYLNNIKILL